MVEEVAVDLMVFPQQVFRVVMADRGEEVEPHQTVH